MPIPVKSFSRTLLINTGLLVGLSIALLGYLWISQEYSQFRLRSEELRVSLLDSHKIELKKQVNGILDYISFLKIQNDEQVRQLIKARVDEAHALASHLYETYAGQKESTQMRALVREALRPIRFNDGRGVYFATSLDGVEQLSSDSMGLEGENILNLQDETGTYIIRDMIELIQQKGEGFYSYLWIPPDSDGRYQKKISYIKYFAPLNWFIGTGMYLDDIEESLQKEVLQRIEEIRFGANGHIFAGQFDGRNLTGDPKEKNMLADSKSDRQRVVAEFIEHARGDGGYVFDVMPKRPGEEPAVTISYVVGMDKWQWYIGASEYVDDIDKNISQARQEMLARVKTSIIHIILVLISLLVVVLLFSRYIILKVKKSFDAFTIFFQESASLSKVLDIDSFHFSEFRQLARLANQMTDEREKVFEELAENEKRYKALFNAASDAIFILEDEVIIDCNTEAKELLGCERHQIIGQTTAHFSAQQQANGSDSQQMIKQNNAEILAGRTLAFEWTLKRYDSTVFDAEVNLKPIRLSGKMYIQAIVHDITEQRKVEQQLIRQASAIEQAAEEIIITDEKGIIEYANPAFEKITGYSGDEFLNKSYFDLYEREEDSSYKEMWSTITDGMVWRGRLTTKRKDGNIVEEDATVSPILSGSGSCMGYVFVKRDVTEQVKVETMFRQTQKMEAIGTLAGGIAHDFNNILAAIFGFAEIAKIETSENSVAQESLGKILDASKRARDLVKQILTFSRQGETSPQAIQVKPIIKETIKLLKASLPSTIEIRENFQSEETVMADPTSIHQIIMNLCSNAAHAMRENGGYLDISLVNVELDQDFARVHPDIVPGQFVKLGVSDTGHGMSRDVKERIFDPFFTSKAEGEGTGMGLSVVHGIVKSLGGTITVYSDEGKGSSFHVFLPIQSERVIVEHPEEEPLPEGTESILFVDDEEFIVEIGPRMLELLGYTVLGKSDSLEALQAFQEDPGRFDLLITDYTMPKMTGIGLAREVKKIRPDLPILLCTGFNAGLAEEEIRQAGITGFILKPVVRKELARIVRQVLDGQPF
ncbi:MAG: cache domain-containing protein [Desulfobulbaceae bacterium]|nr:cache domain-containing protein [Desulfobulbaceae bacterium]